MTTPIDELRHAADYLSSRRHVVIRLHHRGSAHCEEIYAAVCDPYWEALDHVERSGAVAERPLHSLRMLYVPWCQQRSQAAMYALLHAAVAERWLPDNVAVARGTPCKHGEM